jgi:hypothetical protein
MEKHHVYWEKTKTINGKSTIKQLDTNEFMSMFIGDDVLYIYTYIGGILMGLHLFIDTLIGDA